MLPHNYIVALADQIARTWDRQPDDIVLTPLPLFHFNAISICVVGSLIVGGSAAIERRFSVSNFWPEIKRTGATMVSMLGSLAILIANADDHPDQVGHHLRLSAAAPMPPDTDRVVAGALRLQDVQRRFRHDRSVADLDARCGRTQQAGRRGEAQPP